MKIRIGTAALTAVVVAYAGCSSSGTPTGAGTTGSAGPGGAGGGAGSSTTSSSGTAGSGGTPPVTGGGCPTDLGLSVAASLPNLVGDVVGQTVRLRFDPQEKAVDYRVYALPKTGDASGDTIKDATYRCAGDYEIPRPALEDAEQEQSGTFRTRINSAVDGFKRITTDAQLGWVATSPAADRVAVYALGDSAPDSDNVDCYHMRWPESRVKKYTTSVNERAELLAQHWRDDGIAFFALKPGAAGATVVSLANSSENSPLYVTPGLEYDQRKGAGALEEAFSVDNAAAPGLEPLMRVHYEQGCGRGHDELVVGMARFNKAYKQGTQPIAALHWSGLTKETMLVVEALDDLCPFQGIFSPMPRPAQTLGAISYPAFLSEDAMRATSPVGELFLGGQGAATAAPHAIARACIKVAPTAPAATEWHYDGQVETFTAEVSTGFQSWSVSSPTFDVNVYDAETSEWGIGSAFGELRTILADWAADTGGKMRIAPKTPATLVDDSFLHATMEVDVVSSDRRYPQMLISDQSTPIQDNLAKGGTIVVQTRGGNTSPTRAEIQFCDHRVWEVNDQCPSWDLYTLNDGKDFLSPYPEMNGLGGVDRTVMFDVYASTKRVYLYTNGIQYGCVDLPAGKLAAGKATVTFGDVLYHSGVDLGPAVPILPWYPFHQAHMQTETSRHFSNLAFTTKVAAPSWDETRTPCVGADKIHETN